MKLYSNIAEAELFLNPFFLARNLGSAQTYQLKQHRGKRAAFLSHLTGLQGLETQSREGGVHAFSAVVAVPTPGCEVLCGNDEMNRLFL